IPAPARRCRRGRPHHAIAPPSGDRPRPLSRQDKDPEWRREIASDSPQSGKADQFLAVSTSLFFEIQGIMARSLAPTSSIWWESPSARVALKEAWPALFSSTQSRAN